MARTIASVDDVVFQLDEALTRMRAEAPADKAAAENAAAVDGSSSGGSNAGGAAGGGDGAAAGGKSAAGAKGADPAASLAGELAKALGVYGADAAGDDMSAGALSSYHHK